MFEEDVYDAASEQEEDDLSSTYLTMDLAGQMLGIEVRYVREILDRQRITLLPNAPMEVLGVVDVRGLSVPIIDIKSKLAMSGGDTGADARIVVLELEIEGQTTTLGIEADRVRNVEQIGRDAIEAIPSRGLRGWDAGVLEGLYRRDTDLVVLINLGRLLGDTGAELDLQAGAGFF